MQKRGEGALKLIGIVGGEGLMHLRREAQCFGVTIELIKDQGTVGGKIA